MDFIDYLEENFSTSRVSGGTQLVIHDDCPFNGCSGGRIYVDIKKRVGICFKCGQGFGPISFVAAKEGIPKWKAAELLNGVSTGYFGSECEEEVEKKEGWWPRCSPLSIDAINYMERRGFKKEFCQSMGMTFCDVDTSVDGKIYRTAGRVIIPIYNRLGKAVGWQGRDIYGKSKIKYLIQPGFEAGENLFGIQNVTPGCPVIVVEGVMDNFGWIKGGFRNVVATFGKKISDEQLLMLAGLKPTMVFMAWDGDAIQKKFKFAEDYGHVFDIRIVNLGSKDSDELDSGDLHNLIANASRYNWEDSIIQMLKTV